MESFGIGFIQIISYIIIFFAIYLVARKFLKKVIETTEARKSSIEEGLKNSEAALRLKNEKLVEAEAEKEEILKKAYDEARAIIDAAKVKESKILEEASRKAEGNLLYAKQEIEELKSRSKQEGLSDAKEIIAMAIRKTFEGFELSKSDEEKLIEKSLKEIK